MAIDLPLLQTLAQATMGLRVRGLYPPYNDAIDAGWPLRPIAQEPQAERLKELGGLPPGKPFCMHSRMGYIVTVLHSGQPDGMVLMVGPFLPAPPTEAFLQQIAGRVAFSRVMRQEMLTQYRALPVLTEARVLAALRALLPVCGGGAVSQNPVRIDFTTEPLPRAQREPTSEHRVTTRLVEESYRKRGELLRCVAAGRTAAALQALQSYTECTGLAGEVSGEELQQRLFALNLQCEMALVGRGIHPVYLRLLCRALHTEIRHRQTREELLGCPVRIVEKYCELVNDKGAGEHSALVQGAMQYIALNVNEPLTLKTVAAAVGKSEGYLSAQFKKETRLTVTQYIHAQKMEEAAEVLCRPDATVQQAALWVGIGNQGYFCRLFRRHFGVTPQKYRGDHAGMPGPANQETRPAER